MLRYKLRTLLMLLAVMPPLLWFVVACVSIAIQHVRTAR